MFASSPDPYFLEYLKTDLVNCAKSQSDLTRATNSIPGFGEKKQSTNKTTSGFYYRLRQTIDAS